MRISWTIIWTACAIRLKTTLFFVFSAGNESQAQPGVTNGIPLLDEFKESLDGLFVTVVALDKDNKLADYSNACGVAQNYCIAAPGNDVWSPINQDDMIGQMSGTSMAAPGGYRQHCLPDGRLSLHDAAGSGQSGV